MRRTKVVILAGLSILAMLASVVLGLARQSAGAQPELVAVRTATAPVLDGQVDAAWSRATPVTIGLANGKNLPDGKTQVTLKALYDNQRVYFLVQWTDPTQSIRRFPWVKQPDGTWKQLVTNTQGDENQYYEDKLAMIWNMSVKDFPQEGCFGSCHTGQGKPYGNMYWSKPSEIADMWHWKLIRTGFTGQADDQYLDSTAYDPVSAPEAGRKSDPKTAGGYSDNVNAAKNGPAWLGPSRTAPPYYVVDGQKTAFADTFKPGDEVPGIIVATIVGDRGDISAAHRWANGVWTLELSRKLTTGSPYDVQFSNLARTYYFGVAVFDNAQVRHAYHEGAIRFTFAE